MKVLITRRIPQIGMDILSEFADLDIWEEDSAIPRDEFLGRLVGKDAVICLLSDRMDAEAMESGSELKVIGNYAVGYDNIDVEEATRRGIPVLNTPGVLTDATADLAFALILSAARRIPEGDRYIRAGKFKTWGPRLMLGKDLSGMTLGVIGAGKIGSAVLRRARGFGMDLAYNSRTKNKGLEEELGARFLEKDRILREADIISLNCPLTEDTYHLIGERELSMMKDDAVLVNTSRGPVVDEKALYRALKEDRIHSAGLDVFENEPEVFPPLMELDNVIMVPHIGSATVRTRNKMAEMVSRGIIDVIQGRIPPNLVNPDTMKEKGA